MNLYVLFLLFCLHSVKWDKRKANTATVHIQCFLWSNDGCRCRSTLFNTHEKSGQIFISNRLADYSSRDDEQHDFVSFVVFERQHASSRVLFTRTACVCLCHYPHAVSIFVFVCSRRAVLHFPLGAPFPAQTRRCFVRNVTRSNALTTNNSSWKLRLWGVLDL